MTQANELERCDETNTLVKAQNAIDRMARAYKKGKGVRLSWEELEEFNLSLLGEWFSQENPTLTPDKRCE